MYLQQCQFAKDIQYRFISLSDFVFWVVHAGNCDLNIIIILIAINIIIMFFLFFSFEKFNFISGFFIRYGELQPVEDDSAQTCNVMRL